MEPPRPDEAVLGLDNVRLELPIAGAGSRVLAGFVDYAVVAILGILLVFLAIAFAISPVGGWWIAAALLFGFFSIEYGYFAGMELATGGQTLGKKALDLHVLDRQGGRPSSAAILVRNCVRMVDLVIGVPMMVVDPLARRLGDRLGGTVVVHGRTGDSAHVVLRRTPAGWSGDDVALLEGFLQRSRDLEPHRARQLARRLLAAIERDDPALLVGIERGRDPVETLRRAVQADGA